ncbi:MAG TPA: hypothetical protein VKU40_17805 [Thermoanaerobaculia bacterium]|nr:hypothetical protein [Thermoanaerobaculia bacterium]
MQGCRGEGSGDYEAREPGAVGTRIEIHTVYAANEKHPDGCDPETLGCCTEGPFLVRAFAAEVTERGGDGPSANRPRRGASASVASSRSARPRSTASTTPTRRGRCRKATG